MKRKPLLITAGILLLFIITNPSVTAFKTYRGRDSYEGLRRPTNLFVASVYKDHSSEFIGVLGNFWRVNSGGSVTANSNTHKLTVSQFAEKIKQKYPEYKSLDNKSLVDKVLAKYPVYKDTVDLQSN